MADQPPLPQDCADMTDVRAGVDVIDRQLVRLLAQRQRYMTAAARIKPARERVHDAGRIEAVIANIKAEAGREGLSVDIAEPVWRVLIDRCIAYELASWDRQHAAGVAS